MKNKTMVHVVIFLIGLMICWAIENLGIIDSSLTLMIQYIGIYTIFVLGINLVNGYLGIFSLAHAGIMAIGGYVSSLCSMYLFKESWMFPMSLLAGGGAACLAGMILALPSFKVKGDYLAIITLGFSLIVKSVLQNIEFVGGARGLRPIPKYTDLVVVYICVILAILAVKAFVDSKYGRSLLAIRKDQVASELVSVDVRRNKFVVFSFSSFLIGISGGLLCHLLSYTNPNAFGYTTIVDGLVMVYMGGIASISGSIIGATAWQILVQSLRSIGTWRWIGGGLILVMVMIFLPKGICGNKEITISGIKEFFLKITARIKRKGEEL